MSKAFVHTDQKQAGQDSIRVADHIILIGFMGSGKSTIARKLARRENMNSIDIDKAIERETGKRIAEIFASEGEEGFRARERAFLESMYLKERSILSCGGGVIKTAENRETLKRLGYVIYLEVSAEEALSRISHPETRPLLSGPTPVAELLAQRRPLYEGIADIIFDTNGLSIGRVTHELSQLLHERGIL